MNRKEYGQIEAYMLGCMQDSAHDKDHVYRVLYNALTIAQAEGKAELDMDVLIAACLLHDVGRPEQMADPRLCHAQLGSEKARCFLLEMGWDTERTEQVCRCIRTHRFRKSDPPESMEAKILYDADKLDVTGAIGLARTLAYNGAMNEPIYTTAPDGTILDGSTDGEPDSFCREYRYKLEHVYSRFLTSAGARMAMERRQAAADFYRSLMHEVCDTLHTGQMVLEEEMA